MTECYCAARAGDGHRLEDHRPDDGDELAPGEPESATVLHLTNTCPLCGYEPLGRPYTPGGPRYCGNCGAKISGGTDDQG